MGKTEFSSTAENRKTPFLIGQKTHCLSLGDLDVSSRTSHSSQMNDGWLASLCFAAVVQSYLERLSKIKLILHLKRVPPAA